VLGFENVKMVNLNAFAYFKVANSVCVWQDGESSTFQVFSKQ
jgi:hypothetical protein